MRYIEVIVSPKGETKLETKGYAGGECIEASKWLERSLGIAVQDCVTPEYYRHATNDQQVNQ